MCCFAGWSVVTLRHLPKAYEASARSETFRVAWITAGSAALVAAMFALPLAFSAKVEIDKLSSRMKRWHSKYQDKGQHLGATIGFVGCALLLACAVCHVYWAVLMTREVFGSDVFHEWLFRQLDVRLADVSHVAPCVRAHNSLRSPACCARRHARWASSLVCSASPPLRLRLQWLQCPVRTFATLASASSALVASSASFMVGLCGNARN